MSRLVQAVNLTGTHGRIWGEIPQSGQSGLVTVIQTPSSHVSAAIRTQSISIAEFDGKAELLAVVTSKGDTYVFNIPQNRYARVDRTGHAATAAAFSSASIRQLFVGFMVGPQEKGCITIPLVNCNPCSPC